MGKGVKSFHALPQGTHSPQYISMFTNQETPRTVSFWVFYGGFLTQARLIKSLALVIELESRASLPFP